MLEPHGPPRPLAQEVISALTKAIAEMRAKHHLNQPDIEIRLPAGTCGGLAKFGGCRVVHSIAVPDGVAWLLNRGKDVGAITEAPRVVKLS